MKLHIALAFMGQLLFINNATPYATRLESATDRALRTASEEVGIPLTLLRAVCTVESGLDSRAHNRQDGHGGSLGLCQVKVMTAERFGYQGPPEGLFNPDVNAIIAARYLKHQLHRYNGEWLKAITAYNKGSAGIAYRDSRYLQKVLKQLSRGVK